METHRSQHRLLSAERTRKHDFFFFCAQIYMFKAEKSGLKRSRNGQAEKSGLKRSRNGKAEKSGLKRSRNGEVKEIRFENITKWPRKRNEV